MTKSVFFTIFHLGGVFYFVTSGGSSSEKLIPVVGARSGFADEEDETFSFFISYVGSRFSDSFKSSNWIRRIGRCPTSDTVLFSKIPIANGYKYKLHLAHNSPLHFTLLRGGAGGSPCRAVGVRPKGAPRQTARG